MSDNKNQSTTKTQTKEDSEALEALLSQPVGELKSLESLLRKLPEADQREAWRILYGDMPEALTISAEVQSTADRLDFEVALHKFHAASEQRRKPRIVRVAVIQNQIIESTSEPVEVQFQALAKRITEIIEVAGKMDVNVLCLQEAWTMPFAFCTREKQPWLEFAEAID